MTIEERLDDVEKQLLEVKEAVDITEDLDDPISILTPFEGQLNAPLATSRELTKWYLTSYRIFKLLAQTTTIDVDKASGKVRHVSLHPDLKWWADYNRKLLEANAKLTGKREAKIMDIKEKQIDKFIGNLTKEQQDQLAKAAYKEVKHVFGGSSG